MLNWIEHILLRFYNKYFLLKNNFKKKLILYKSPAGVYLHPSVDFKEDIRIDYLLFKGEFSVSERVKFRSFCSILLLKNAVLHIHKNVFFNNYCSINCLDKIEIGENTLFGEGVKMYDHNHKHEFINGDQLIERNEFTTAPIKIGKNCWIGSNVIILKGVEIGDNVIIGANCLIYKSVPANSILKSGDLYNIEAK